MVLGVTMTSMENSSQVDFWRYHSTQASEARCPGRLLGMMALGVSGTDHSAAGMCS